MAIAFDASSSGESATLTTTIAHTCSGTDRILIVGINVNSTSDKITGVTYNSVPMTRIVLASATTTGTRAVTYYLVNPSTGANNIVVTSTDTTYRWCAAASYTGVNQTGQPDASNSATATATTSISISTTTIADNCWIVGFFWSDANTAFTAGANTTRRITGFYSIMDTNAAQTPAGNYSIAGSWTNNNSASVCSASIKPVSIAVSNNNNNIKKSTFFYF